MHTIMGGLLRGGTKAETSVIVYVYLYIQSSMKLFMSLVNSVKKKAEKY